MKRLLIAVIGLFLVAYSTISISNNDIFAKAVKAAKSSASVSAAVKEAGWPTKGWSVSTPEAQGMTSIMLNKANNKILDNYPNLYSLLVIRHGYLVYEKYYNGMTRKSYNPVYSVTKSFMSALTGIAIQNKLINGVDQKLSDFFPEYFNTITNSKIKNLTIQNTLTMTAGLESIDNNYIGYFTSSDWLKYTLDRPLIADPGKKFIYNTGMPHFLSALITKASKMNTYDYANKVLLKKIGITIPQWDKDPLGYYAGGTGINLTPVDMAKFGYLYLKNGSWDGEQVIPKQWIADTTKKYISVSPGIDYGYLFWIQTLKDKVYNKSYYTYRADGAGGQRIVVVPSLDMVVVITANINMTSIDNTETLDIVPDYVLPAVIR